MKRLKHFTIQLLTAFSALVLLLSLSALIVMNSGILDQFAKERVISAFNKKFVGRLDVEKVQLKFPNNVTLIQPRIYAKGSSIPALDARRVSLKVNLLSLLQPEIRILSLNRLTADSLTTKIIEQDNGKLNLELVFASRDPDTTKAPLDFFFCKKLRLKNSRLTFSGNKRHTNNLQLSLQQINLELSGVTAKKHLFKGSLDNLQFVIPDRHLSLQRSSAKFLFSETRSELLSLKAATNKSRAELSVSLDRFNIFSPKRWQQLGLSSAFFNIENLTLHSDDLRLFNPDLALPTGIYTLQGSAKSKKDDLEILDLRLTHEKSHLALKGEVLNLSNSKTLAYRLECDSSKIAAPFVESLLKESSQKELARKAGDLTFLGRARGNLKEIQTDLSLLSPLAKATLSVEASKKESQELACKGKFVIKGFQAHKLIEPNAKSLFNASGSFDGLLRNRQLNRLTLEMKLFDSFWQNQPLKEGTVSILYSNNSLQSKLALKNNPTSLDLDGEIEWKENTPRYRANGKCERLDLSLLLPSHNVATDLNGTFALQGSGFDPAKLNLAAVMLFSPSTINKFQLKEQSKATLAITQTSHSSRASINSDFLDMQAEGDYGLEQLIALYKLSYSGITREINTQNIWRQTSGSPFTAPALRMEPFRVNYHIKVKDIAPLALLFPVEGLSLQGSADGTALYQNGQCAINSSIHLDRLHTKNDLLLENLAMDATVECNGSGTAKASVSGKTASMSLAGKRAGEVLFSGTYTPSVLEGTVEVTIPDPAQKLSAKVSAIKNANSYDLLIKQLSLKNSDGIWLASAGSHVVIGNASARFNRFTIAKGEALIVLDGELSNSLPGSFQLTLSGIELKEVQRFALDAALNKLSGKINASLTVSGNPGLKTSALLLNGQNISYDNIAIGTLQCKARHSNNLLQFESQSRVPQPGNLQAKATPVNTIEGRGTIPLLLGYYPLHYQLAEPQPISASFHSDNLSAQFVTLLLPFIESAEGVIPTTLRVEGRTPKPDIYLSSHLRDIKIKVAPTQASYRLNGEVYVTPQAIDLREIKIRDTLNGNGSVTGLIKLEKLEPGELALDAKFEKLLLFNKADKKDESSFGTITGSSSNLMVRGKISAPMVSGELKVNSADFSIYRLGANESAKYIGVEKFVEFRPRNPARRAAAMETGKKAQEFYHSLIDILQINDLKLSNVEPLKGTVIFDRIRGEQLESLTNNLYLIVNKNNQHYRLFGSVNVIGGKYKFSNSNFDLQDGGKITWNNVEIRDGVMDNLYGSKYINASNQQSGETDNVRLLIAITGTINEPLIAMGYYLNEQTQPYASTTLIGGQSAQRDPNSELNVISMLLSKQWYVRPGSTYQSGNLGVSTVGISTGTGLLSSQFSRVIQNFSGLESFNVNLGTDKRGLLSGLDLYFALNVPGTDGKVRFIGTGTAPTLRESAGTDYYGTAQKIEYRVTPKIYVEAYRSYGTSSNATSINNLQKPSETWGLSLSYKERFHTWDEFWKRLIPSGGQKK